MQTQIAYLSLRYPGQLGRDMRGRVFVRTKRTFAMRALMVSPYTLGAGFRIQVVLGYRIVLHDVELDAIARRWRGVGWVALHEVVQTATDLQIEIHNTGPEPRAFEAVAVGREYQF